MRDSVRSSVAGRLRGTIVALDTLKSDPQRVRVMVRVADQSRARCMCVILRGQVQALRLKVGGAWSPQVAARIATRAEAESVREAALRMVASARRTPSAAAVAARLRELGHSAQATAAAIRQLRSDGWISDSIRAP